MSGWIYFFMIVVPLLLRAEALDSTHCYQARLIFRSRGWANVTRCQSHSINWTSITTRRSKRWRFLPLGRAGGLRIQIAQWVRSSKGTGSDALFCDRFRDDDDGDGDRDRVSAASLRDDVDDDDEDDDLEDDDDDDELREPPPAALESESELLDRDLRRDVRFVVTFFFADLAMFWVADDVLEATLADDDDVPLSRLLPDAVLLPVDMGLLLPLSFRYCEQFSWPKSAEVMPTTLDPAPTAGDDGGSFQLPPVTDTLRL